MTTDHSQPQKLIITNLAPRKVNGVEVTPRKWETGGRTFIEFMEKTDTGIYRFAEQPAENSPPTVVTPKECHLKFPITGRDSWNMTTKVGNTSVNVNLTIDSVSDEVKVPAGTFKDCLKIRQVGENDAGVAVLGNEWSAPKVGVVKSTVIIKTKSKEGTISSESRTFELQSFKP
ncbi:MAG: hypothetical protein WBV23_06255 [Desulfobaccales bacterium]